MADVGFDVSPLRGQPIDGEDVAVVRVPGGWLHRRRIIKYSAPLCIAEVSWRPDGPVGPRPPEAIAEATPDGWRVTGLAAQRDGHRVRLHLAPGLPDLRSFADGREARGRWWVTVDDARLTGGAWHVHRVGDVVQVGLDADERWRPGWLPALMRVVVRLVPRFRRWPTTYRWRAEVRLGAPAHAVRRLGARRTIRRPTVPARPTGAAVMTDTTVPVRFAAATAGLVAVVCVLTGTGWVAVTAEQQPGAIPPLLVGAVPRITHM